MKRYLTLGLLLVMAAVAVLAVASAQAKPPPPPPPAFSFVPAGSYDFEAIAVGRSPSMDVTLSYQGKGSSGPISTSVTGGSTFTISADTCAGKRTSSRKTCTITVTYTPTAVGNSDTATLTASATGVATASLSLSGTGFTNNQPTADPDSVTTTTGTPVEITLSGSDPDSDYLTFAIDGGPSYGTLTAINPVSTLCLFPGGCSTPVTYTPNAGYTGSDSFTYTVHDGLVASATATVSITVGSGTCTAGSENFSSAAVGSQPTTFAGGTIDDDYGEGGQVLLAEASWASGGYPAGTHIIWTGTGIAESPFFLRFDKAVGSVQVETYPYAGGVTMTLAGWDASGEVVDTDSQTGGQQKYTLAIASTSNNIKILKFSAIDTYNGMYGFTFTNLVWTCN